MAFADQVFYCNAGDQSTTGHYAVAKFAASTAYSAGQLVRQLTAPAVGSERVFVVIVAGTSSTEPSWTVTRGGKNTSGAVTFQECTGAASLNGDLTNTPNWTTQKATGTPTLGAIIKRNNSASYQICSTAGTLGASEPAFSDTAGATTTEGTTTWTSLGAVSNFTGGQAPHARLANACASTWFAAGNTVYVGDNHAESQTTAININPGVANTITSSMICHNHSGSYPPVSSDLRTTATVSTTANVAINILSTSNVGPVYFYGLTFKCSVGATGNAAINIGFSSTGNNWLYFDNCSFWLASTTGFGYISIVGATVMGGNVIFNNTSVKFAAATQSINAYGAVFIWQNTTPALVSGSTVPTNLMTCGNLTFNAVLEALDLSTVTTSLFYIQSATYAFGNVLIKDCKLNASATVTTPTNTGITAQLVRCDSAATAYKSARYQYEGTETTETSITRVGGAADPTGQAQSRRIVTTVNSQWLRPFKAEPYAIWNPTTGANVAVTVCGTVNAGALPNNDDIWLEVEYLGSSASPLGMIVTTTKSNLLAANAAVASDGSTWNTPHTTFDGPITNPAYVTLSNGNLTATKATTNSSMVISTAFLYAGKYYFEIAIGQWSVGQVPAVGVLLSTGIINDALAGNNFVGVLLASNTFIYSNNASTGKNLGASSVSADVYSFAIDLTNRLAWIRKNGGNWNADAAANPATGTNGVTIAGGSFAPVIAFASAGGSGNNMTANFGQSSYSYTPPIGFNSWDTGWTPFKLTTTLSSPQPGLAGYLHARVRVAKPSLTVFVDPMVTLS